MTSEPLATENELDIRKLFQLLWNGKQWIVGLAIIFAGVALIYSYLVKQEWVSVAIMTKPSITSLNSYYEQRQFVINTNNNLSTNKNVSIADSVYSEFLQQLGAYDTRRDFWLQSDYYLQRKEGDSKADAALLNEFVDNIALMLSNPKSPSDNIQLTAETGADARVLLNEYINFAADRTVSELNQELTTLWAERLQQLTTKMQQLKASSDADYERKVNSLKQALETQRQPTEHKGGYYSDDLNRELNALTIDGPQPSDDYYQGQVILARLSEPLKLTGFQPYRFLRTPDEPVKRSKPRRLFLLILWGTIGGFCGAGIALTRRKNTKVGYN